ncbi:MAG: hypothetical protein QXU64_03305 [Thermofilaceae archaeon]
MILELWSARREGRFGIKHYILAWIVSARLFAVPWVALFTLFGALLAGITSVEMLAASIAVVVCALLASHFNNNYMDVLLGVDRYVDSPEEAKRLCSTIKPYTAAAWIVPLRITSIEFQKINEHLFLALAAIIYALMYSRDLTALLATLPVAVLGIILVKGYTTLFKPRGLGELACFLGHGFGATAFGYLSQKPDLVMAFLAAIPPGLISALAYSIDQFVDIKTDFVRRVRAVYESWFNSRMPLGLYVIVAFGFWINTVIAWVAADIYPRGVLLVLALTPLVLYYAPQLEYDRERTIARVVIISVFLVPLLMCVGALIR